MPYGTGSIREKKNDINMPEYHDLEKSTPMAKNARGKMPTMKHE
jgi:hypothetical protein